MQVGLTGRGPFCSLASLAPVAAGQNINMQVRAHASSAQGTRPHRRGAAENSIERRTGPPTPPPAASDPGRARNPLTHYCARQCGAAGGRGTRPAPRTRAEDTPSTHPTSPTTTWPARSPRHPLPPPHACAAFAPWKRVYVSHLGRLAASLRVAVSGVRSSTGDEASFWGSC